VDIELTQEENQVIELLRTPKLSIKYLDEETKQKIRRFLQRLHHEERISLSDIAKLIGNKTSGYTSWLARQLGIQPRDFEEARIAGIRQKVRKYERKPFDGTDEDKAYLLGLRHGDISASRPFGDATRVSTSTTHPAMDELFNELFEPYGHVYRHPRYKKDTRTYEWNLSAILDESFGFLMAETKSSWKWIAKRDSTVLAYLAGLFDAEGHAGIYPNRRTTAITMTYYNTNIELLDFVHKCLTELGHKPLRPYLDKPKGFRSPGFNIEMKKDYWRVMIANFDESKSLLRKLPLRHREKIAKQELALSIEKGEPWTHVKDRIVALRNKIKNERVQFTQQAEQEFLRRHDLSPS
jgi:hypothetical protein